MFKMQFSVATLGLACLAGMCLSPLLAEVKRLTTLNEAKSAIARVLSTKGVNSAVAEKTLDTDRKQVREAAIALAAEGMPKSEADQRTAWAWYWLRAGVDAVPITQSLDRSTIQATARGYAPLSVRSEPSGASVMIDRQESPDPTDTDMYVKPGEHLITVQMPGFAPAQR